MRISKNINIVPVFEIADENFAVIEFSRRKMFNNINPKLCADMYTVELFGIGFRVFVENSQKVEVKNIKLPLLKMPMTNEQLHEFRKQIDSCIKIAGGEPVTLPATPYSLAIKQAYIKLVEAKMWIGKCLEANGAPFPADLKDEAQMPITNNPFPPNSTGGSTRII